MEVYFDEEYNVTRNYIYDIEPGDFLNWLNGRKPNEDNLVEYIRTISPFDVTDDEYMIESGFKNLDDFLEEVEQYE